MLYIKDIKDIIYIKDMKDMKDIKDMLDPLDPLDPLDSLDFERKSDIVQSKVIKQDDSNYINNMLKFFGTPYDLLYDENIPEYITGDV
ncbi:hypothetical protein C2G38_2158839 [Gigaspora rosea]|uniref:Uncharacterized protein n=1 Tax=Gigaspora rosea TaxID=44941 RepID=A0A397W718_9GLOM|nr:hypothetical protein C2G38_2158839 [Gigaspora rosea]